MSTERNLYLPLKWNETENSMGVFVPVSALTPQPAAAESESVENPLFLVEAVSTFRMRYVVRCQKADHAADTVVMEQAMEFSQKHLDENIISVRQISDAEYLELFDQDNDYLKSWTQEQKFGLVHDVDAE